MFGIRTVEEAPYTVERIEGIFELHKCEQLVVVQTLVEASFDEGGAIAFERLFGYVPHENASDTNIAMTALVLADPAAQGEQIAMTAPVLREHQGDAWHYRFVLPSTYTRDSAPAPANPEVDVAVVPQTRVARYATLASGAKKPCGRRLGSCSPGSKPKVWESRLFRAPPVTIRPGPCRSRKEILVDIK